MTSESFDPAFVAGSVLFARTIEPASAEGAHFHGMAYYRGETVRWRTTCLACGAVAAHTPSAVEGTDEAALERWMNTRADTHDASGCLTTFTTDRAEMGPLLDRLSRESLESGADAFLDEIARLALDGSTDQVVVVGTPTRALSLNASIAFLAAMHRTTPHSALVAHDYALREELNRAAGRGITAVCSEARDLKDGARRWWLFVHDRVLPFETYPMEQPGVTAITPVSTRFLNPETGAEYAVDPFRLLVATQLGAI
jgi:hypothetical protein